MPKKYALKTDVPHKTKQKKKNHFALAYVGVSQIMV